MSAYSLMSMLDIATEAAKILDEHAEVIKRRNTFHDGTWGRKGLDLSAKAKYDRVRGLADALRCAVAGRVTETAGRRPTIGYQPNHAPSKPARPPRKM